MTRWPRNQWILVTLALAVGLVTWAILESDEHEVQGLSREAERGTHVTAGSRPELADASGKETATPGLDHRQPVKSAAQSRMDAARDSGVHVRVLDANGAPAEGVTVWLCHEKAGDPTDVASRQTEGPEALAQFDRILADAQVDAGRSYFVEVRTLGRESPRVDFDFESYGGELLTLQLPELGELAVYVFEVDGTRFAGEGRLAIQGVTAETIANPLLPGVGPIVSKRKRPGTDPILFEQVAVGTELSLVLHRGAGKSTVQRQVLGPSRAGERVRVDLRLGSDEPLARLRALDTERQPIASMRLSVQLVLKTARMASTSIQSPQTDEAGYFQLDLPKGMGEGTRLELKVARSDDSQGLESGTLVLARHFAPGVHDLGDVLFERSILLAAGRVVDAAGDAVEGARVRIEQKNEDSERWTPHEAGQVQTDERGEFELWGFLKGEALRIAPSRDGFVSPWVHLAPGTEHLELRLLAGGTVAGSLLLDPEIPPSKLHLSLNVHELAEGYSMGGFHAGALSEEGTFRIEGLAPGSYNLNLAVGGQWLSAHRIDEVIVPAAGDAHDPRLERIDLRGKLHTHRVLIEGLKEGEKLHGTITYGPTGAKELSSMNTSLQSGMSLFGGDEIIDVALKVQGHLAQRVNGVREEVSFQLRPSPRVVLVLPQGLPLPEPPLAIAASLLVPGIQLGFLGNAGAAPNAHNKVHLKAPALGELHVQWQIGKTVGHASSYQYKVFDPPHVIDVADVPGVQRFPIQLTQEQLDELVALTGE